MTATQQLITILMCTAATMLTRFLPFLIFREGKQIPHVIQYLGKALPSAIFAMLVVYCFKNVDILHVPYGAPEFLALVITVGTHIWKRNTLLSMAIGTVAYMALVQFIF